MKPLLSILVLLLLTIEANAQSASWFQSNLSNIYHEFSKNISNRNNCEDLANRAYQLRSDIEDALEDESYTRRESNQLQELSKESKATHDYIRAVGDCSKGIVSTEDFNLVNRSINNRINIFNENNYCIDIVSLTINEFTSYLALNNSNYNYTVSYSWNASSSFNRGKGTMGLPSKSMRTIYTNRDEPSDRDISVQNISCKVF